MLQIVNKSHSGMWVHAKLNTSTSTSFQHKADDITDLDNDDTSPCGETLVMWQDKLECFIFPNQ